MSKKPHPTVQVTVKLSPQAADKLYKVINEEFEGNISEALREAIKLLIKSKEPLKVFQLEFADEKVEKVGPAYDAADHVGTELILRLEESADETK